MTIFSGLHASLAIPEDFHLADTKAPKLSKADRQAALIELVASGEATMTDTLLDNLVRRLTKLKAAALKDDPSEKADRPKGKKLYRAAPFFAEKEKQRLAKKAEIIEALLANPKARATELGRQYGVNESTARNYRRQLKAEGKLP